MKKILGIVCLIAMSMSLCAPCLAGTNGKDGKISGKSVGACALSFLIWPGIGQAVNDQKDDKILTHALLGLTGIFRIWSGYDALRDREGGVWKNRI